MRVNSFLRYSFDLLVVAWDVALESLHGVGATGFFVFNSHYFAFSIFGL